MQNWIGKGFGSLEMSRGKYQIWGSERYYIPTIAAFEELVQVFGKTMVKDKGLIWSEVIDSWDTRDWIYSITNSYKKERAICKVGVKRISQDEQKRMEYEEKEKSWDWKKER